MSASLRASATALLCAAMWLASGVSRASSDIYPIYELVDDARITFARFASRPEMSWFRERLSDVWGVMVVPRMDEASFIVGAAWGDGVLLARDHETGEWSEPVFYSITGGTLGYQIGVARHEGIMLIMTEKGLEKLAKPGFFLSGGLVAAAGPVGSTAGGSIGGADYVNYGRSKGIIVSASIAGSGVRPKNDWHEIYYGKPVTPYEIVTEEPVNHWYSERLRNAVRAAAENPW